MSKKLNEELLMNIYAIVEEIPEGKVATYGQIASLINCPKNARLIGKAMSLAPFYGNFPCHRVVNSKGALVSSWKEQKELLLKEKVIFKNNDCVNLNKSKWKTE